MPTEVGGGGGGGGGGVYMRLLHAQIVDGSAKLLEIHMDRSSPRAVWAS